MKKLKNLGLFILLIFLTTSFSLLSSCEDKNTCPDGMVECTLQNGDDICVPSHVGC